MCSNIQWYMIYVCYDHIVHSDTSSDNCFIICGMLLQHITKWVEAVGPRHRPPIGHHWGHEMEANERINGEKGEEKPREEVETKGMIVGLSCIIYTLIISGIILGYVITMWSRIMTVTVTMKEYLSFLYWKPMGRLIEEKGGMVPYVWWHRRVWPYFPDFCSWAWYDHTRYDEEIWRVHGQPMIHIQLT